MKIEILKNKDAIAIRAAQLLCEGATALLEKSDSSDFSIALAGGSTPKLLFQMLTRPPWRDDVPWDRIRWYLGDERFVGPDHPDSNFRMIRENLFDPASVPESRQIRMETELSTPQETAEDYAEKFKEQLSLTIDATPAFDLMLLGMGDDGHTASLFPHTAALDEQTKPVVANWVEKLDAWRITITPPVLLAARQRIVLVTGEEKAPALAEVLQGELDVKRYPAQLLREALNTTWLIDEVAAKLLK